MPDVSVSLWSQQRGVSYFFAYMKKGHWRQKIIVTESTERMAKETTKQKQNCVAWALHCLHSVYRTVVGVGWHTVGYIYFLRLYIGVILRCFTNWKVENNQKILYSIGCWRTIVLHDHRLTSHALLCKSAWGAYIRPVTPQWWPCDQQIWSDTCWAPCFSWIPELVYVKLSHFLISL